MWSTFFVVKGTFFYFKQLPSNSSLNFELHYLNFEEKLLLNVVGGLILSFDSPLDCYAMTVSVRPVDIVQALKY